MPKLTRIVSYPLPEGGTASVSKWGRKFHYTRTCADITQPPESVVGLSKAEALGLLADALRQGVLEDA